jgi:hypothetical protein
MIRFIKNHFLFFILVFILVFIRDSLLLSELWSTKFGGDLPESMIYGNFAYDLLNKTWRNLECYLWVTNFHVGEAFFVNLVALPLYAIFSPSQFVLSQVPIIYSIVIVMLVYFLCIRYFNKIIALLSVSLIVFMPMEMQQWLLYSYVSNFETVLFFLIETILFIEILFSKSLKMKKILFYLLGFFIGISIFHSEFNVLTVVTLLLSLIILARKGIVDKKLFSFSKKEIICFSAFIFVGMIPYFSYYGYVSIANHDKIIYKMKYKAIPKIKNKIGKLLHRDDIGKTETINNKEIDKNPVKNMKKVSISTIPAGFFHAVKNSSILFWPINAIFLNKGHPVLISILGIFILLIVMAIKTDNAKEKLLVLIIPIYSFLNIASLSIVGPDYLVTRLYYFYSGIVPVLVACSIIIFRMAKEWIKTDKLFPYIIILLSIMVCGHNIMDLGMNIKFSNFCHAFSVQMNSKGCSFYWPFKYSGPSNGQKTELTKKIDSIAANVTYGEDVQKTRYTKTIFISKIRKAFIPLDSSHYQYLYGVDIAYKGLSAIVEEIKQNADTVFQEKAFSGLAVFYVNDTWKSQIIKDLRSKIIQNTIPHKFQKYFYQEIRRKMDLKEISKIDGSIKIDSTEKGSG